MGSSQVPPQQGIPFGNTAGRPSSPGVGQPYFNGQISRLEIFSQTTGWRNIVSAVPEVTSFTGRANESATSTIVVNGTNFEDGAIVSVIGTNSVETQALSTTYVSLTEVTAIIPQLNPAFEPYDIKVTNISTLYGVLFNSLYVNNVPTWTQPAGSLGTYTELQSMSIAALATDASDEIPTSLTYSIISGALPTGISLNTSTGVISGTPVNVVSNTTYSFTVQVSDGINPSISRAFSITIADRAPVWSTPQTLPTATLTASYSTTLSATDDDGLAASPYTITVGSLPTGLTLNSTTGVISGTPSSGTSATFTVRAIDANGNFSDRQFTLPIIQWTSLTFTPGGNTGRSGPSSAQVAAGLTAVGVPTYTVASGIIQLTIPTTGTYRIDCYGARGGNANAQAGGQGARARGDFSLTAGQVIQLLVGQMGSTTSHSQDGLPIASGGGWSGAVTSGGSALIIAGGGGGATSNSWSVAPGQSANTSTSGTDPTNNNYNGSNGNGATNNTTGGPAAGFLTNGTPGSGSSDPARSFANGALGGESARSWGGGNAYGGFGGGGGGGGLAGGGGGGYSGGAGGSWTSPQQGGGGGSYNTGTNQIMTSPSNTGDGYIIIQYIA